jgi:hypothetical protein
MKAENLLERIEGNICDVINNIDLVMALIHKNIKNTTTITMSYVLTVTTYQRKVN